MPTTSERVQQLSDREAVALYDRVSRTILSGSADVDKIERRATEITGIDPEGLEEVEISTDDAIPFVRHSLGLWANDPNMAPVIDNLLDNPVQTYGVGIILSLGALLVTTIASTSIKAEYKNGKWSFSYTTGNISDNAVKIVNKFFGVLPDNLKKLTGIK